MVLPRIWQCVAAFGVVIGFGPFWPRAFRFATRSPVQLREGNPKGRDRSPSPLSRFKGVRGEIEIPPGFSLGGEGGHFSFQKRNVPPFPPHPGQGALLPALSRARFNPSPTRANPAAGHPNARSPTASCSPLLAKDPAAMPMLPATDSVEAQRLAA